MSVRVYLSVVDVVDDVDVVLLDDDDPLAVVVVVVVLAPGMVDVVVVDVVVVWRAGVVVEGVVVDVVVVRGGGVVGGLAVVGGVVVGGVNAYTHCPLICAHLTDVGVDAGRTSVYSKPRPIRATASRPVERRRRNRA